MSKKPDQTYKHYLNAALKTLSSSPMSEGLSARIVGPFGKSGVLDNAQDLNAQDLDTKELANLFDSHSKSNMSLNQPIHKYLSGGHADVQTPGPAFNTLNFAYNAYAKFTFHPPRLSVLGDFAPIIDLYNPSE